MIPKKERCNKCDAKGFTEYKPCQPCSGSGRIAMKQDGVFNISGTCMACRGTGRAGSVSCDECKGQSFVATGNFEISVTIPPGVETGHQVRVQGYGEPSLTSGKNGDLHIIILVKDHKIFKRHGVNLSYEFPVGFSELCLGASVDVPTLTGKETIIIPPKTQDYTQIRLKGSGLPYFHGGKGDLIVVVKLITPSSEIINSNKELIEKFGEFEKNYLTEERNKLI